VVADQVIAIIDTEATAKVSPIPVSAAPVAAEAAPSPAPAAAAAATGGAKGDVAMPAAAKILSEKGLSATDVAGSGKDGRVTKGDALAASAPAKPAAAAPAPAATAA
jgi:2-oxoglutarate dehydrogenase E2 component (dihydrolipoamide succinyltransferase)